MGKYGFESIGKKESKEYGEGFDLAKVRGAALKYAQSNGVPLRTRLSRDGKTLIVSRGPFDGKSKGRCIYGFSEYEIEEFRTYTAGQILNGYRIESLRKVRYAALKYGKRHGMVFKTRMNLGENSISVKRFS